MTKLTAALAICLTAVLPLAANAEVSLKQSRAAYKAACKADMEKFCATAEKKGTCLKEHIKEVSIQCRDARKAYRQAKRAA